MNRYLAIGLMSGSSLDGLDIACCEFVLDNGLWSFSIQQTDVVAYPDEWMQEFKRLPIASARTLWETHTALGHFFGEQVNLFIEKHQLQGQVYCIGSHGHTIFHFPEKRFTTQIGDGAAIAAKTNLPVACDFRSADIADGGQGTPIVPIGDLMLFRDYRFCLNIGGIANISCKTDNSIIAFDICPANQILNMLSNRTGKEYDEGGTIAASGALNQELLNNLNALPYYTLPYPKSLDNSFSREVIIPVLEASGLSLEDKMRTYVEHIAVQTAQHKLAAVTRENIALHENDQLLITGGGAFNTFLIERIKENTHLKVHVPDERTVKFKEALVIAFMGVLRMRNEINVLRSVTGASKDSVGGAVYRP